MPLSHRIDGMEMISQWRWNNAELKTNYVTIAAVFVYT